MGGIKGQRETGRETENENKEKTNEKRRQNNTVRQRTTKVKKKRMPKVSKMYQGGRQAGRQWDEVSAKNVRETI
eukprot:765438-Hanusia_phi.AAC.3